MAVGSITLAQDKSAAERVNAIWVEADMRHIQLDEPVDVAFCMFDGLDALLTHEELQPAVGRIAGFTANDCYFTKTGG